MANSTKRLSLSDKVNLLMSIGEIRKAQPSDMPIEDTIQYVPMVNQYYWIFVSHNRDEFESVIQMNTFEGFVKLLFNSYKNV